MDFSFSEKTFETLKPSAIEMPSRLRVTDADYVEALKLSIEEKGQMQPIEVAKNPRRKGKKYVLVSGAHRLAACTALDMDVVCGIVSFKGKVSDFDTACRLREVDENLIRHDLNPLDRAVHLNTRKKIYEELNPATAHGGDRKSADFSDKNQNDTVATRFSAETAEKLGLSERTIQRACEIAENIPAELQAKIAGTWLSQKQGELLKLSKQGPEAQEKIVDQLLHEEEPAKSVDAAMKILAGGKGKAEGSTQADDADYKRLKTVFNKSPATVKKRFLAYLKFSGELDDIDAIADQVFNEQAESTGGEG